MDLLTYRYTGDAYTLLKEVVKAVNAPIVQQGASLPMGGLLKSGTPVHGAIRSAPPFLIKNLSPEALSKITF